MNTATLKTFAPLVRRQLIEAVTQKLDFVLLAKTPDYLATFAKQVAALRKLADEDRNGLIERIAYTWFNRLAALRYLDARGWHPFRARVLTAAGPEETQPEILKLARAGALPEELRSHLKGGAARLNDLLDGRIPSPDAQGEVYRHLVLAACHFYNALLPDLFERLDDETELLLPDDLLTEQSVAQGFRTEMTDEDCAEVEVLGWLYQFYISERKDEVMNRRAAVQTADMPAVTQLFTPHWIVRYLVENSLGRLWLLNRPESRLREQMPYYIQAPPEVDFLRINKPEQIRLLDPAVGSGHMLTYAFDLLCAIYEEEGYAPSDIPGLILTHNLYGLDVCPRAVQLAELALVLKARENSRSFFQANKSIRPHILSLSDVQFGADELREYVEALDLGGLFTSPVTELLHQFGEAATLGSLIEPSVGEDGIAFLRTTIEARDVAGQLFLHESHTKVLSVLQQAEMLSRRYHVTVTNPPYLGTGKMTRRLQEFARGNYPDEKADLYSMFIRACVRFAPNGGYAGLVTMHSWMFLDSFERLRSWLLERQSLESMLHLGSRAFDAISGEVVQSTAFVVCTTPKRDKPCLFFRLTTGADSAEKEQLFLKGAKRFAVAPSEFHQLPGSPLSYWVPPAMRRAFASGVPLGSIVTPKKGLITSDNGRFLRLWHEVGQARIGFHLAGRAESVLSSRRWFPYNKGGGRRKWFGSNEYVINWENDGQEVIAYAAQLYGSASRQIQNKDSYFHPCITWTAISSSGFTARYCDEGFVFDSKGPSIFGQSKKLKLALGLLLTNVGDALLSSLNSTMDYLIGNVAAVPVLELDDAATELVIHNVEEAVSLGRSDWNNFESSWDFCGAPLLRSELKESTIAASWRNWKAFCEDTVLRMQQLESENNRLFIDAYGLQDELQPNVCEGQITLARANIHKDMVAFLSYAVGCVMGRYSIDYPGLILANAGDTLDQYFAIVGKNRDELRFLPSESGVIPILDGEWFEDDIVARTREFLRTSFGEATLRENVRFIEESLGKELRKYFLSDFYKDHLQAYKKRPIYWLIQSPRKSFSVLIYLHRYRRDTINLVLNRYLRDYQVKLRNRAAHLAQMLASDATSARDKTEARKEADRISKMLHECEEWERQILLPLAQARIGLDLDDGVKVNYLKLGEALAPVVGMESKTEE